MPLNDVIDRVEQQAAMPRIQAQRRLVQQQNRRRFHHGAGQQYQALQAEAQRVEFLAARCRQAEGRQPRERRAPLHVAGHGPRPQRVAVAREHDIDHAAAAGHGVLQLGIYATEAGFDIPNALAAAAQAPEQSQLLSISLVIVARQHVEQGALAAAVGAGDQTVVMRFETPVQLAKHAELAEARLHVAQLDARCFAVGRGARRGFGRRLKGQLRRGEHGAYRRAVQVLRARPGERLAAAVQQQDLRAGRRHIARAAAQHQHRGAVSDDRVQGAAEAVLRCAVQPVQRAVQNQQFGSGEDGAGQQRFAQLPGADIAQAAFQDRPQMQQIDQRIARRRALRRAAQ